MAFPLLIFSSDTSPCFQGTLTPIVKVPSEALPTPLCRETIVKLSEDPKNIVYLISGRDSDFLEEHWGNVRLLGLSAEHGCFVRQPGSNGWDSLTDSLDMVCWRSLSSVLLLCLLTDACFLSIELDVGSRRNLQVLHGAYERFQH